jgi:hypothetical protein
VKIAAEKIGKGAEKFAVHAGGQELGMHDPRLVTPFGGWTVTRYQMDATPGRHTPLGRRLQQSLLECRRPVPVRLLRTPPTGSLIPTGDRPEYYADMLKCERIATEAAFNLGALISLSGSSTQNPGRPRRRPARRSPPPLTQ